MKKILCIGSVTVDVLASPVNGMPKPGTLQGVDSVEVHPGGCAVNAALDLQKLGGNVALSCLIGEDSFGELLKSRFQKAGLPLDGVVQTSLAGTTVSVVLIQSSGERSFLYYPGSSALFEKKHIAKTLTEEADIVFVAGVMLLPSFEGQGLADFMKEMKASGKMTVMDTAWDKDGEWLPKLLDALPYTDLFMPSLEEAAALSGQRDPEKMADFFFDLGCSSVVIKLGKKGALICEKRDKRFYLPALSHIAAVDTTGAGDSFCAGFLFGISSGWDFDACGRFANAVAACCVSATGASTGIRTYEETLKLLGGSHDEKGV